MKYKIAKALTFILMAVVFTAALLPHTVSFAMPQKMSKELVENLKSSNNISGIPVIVQTTEGIKSKHISVMEKHAGKLKHDLSLIKSLQWTPMSRHDFLNSKRHWVKC